MTSLIDVIFLLLLFFMLSSTFSRFSEVEIVAAGSNSAPSGNTPLFLRLGLENLSLNGQPETLETLPAVLEGREVTGAATPLLVSLLDDVSAQRLTDILVVLRGIQGLRVTVLGAS